MGCGFVESLVGEIDGSRRFCRIGPFDRIVGIAERRFHVLFDQSIAEIQLRILPISLFGILRMGHEILSVMSNPSEEGLSMLS